MNRRKRVSEGIYQDRYGLAATVKVNGKQQEIRFPPGTSLRKIQIERNRMKTAMQGAPKRRPPSRNTLEHDAERYLEQVGPLVSLVNRRREIGVWLPRFGHLRTSALPNHVNALNAQLRQWRAKLAASTVNHRRNALTNLVSVLYGRKAAAELVELKSFKAEPPKPRWIDRQHVAEVLDRLQSGTKTAPRLRLMHWTGMRPSQMGRLTREDFRLDEPIPFVAVPRGKRGKIANVPLVTEAVDTAREFIEANAFGKWSCASANKMLRTAAEEAGRAPFTVYQIRHSFAAALRRTGTDLADISNMIGHTNKEITETYAPPEIGKHQEAIERLRKADSAPPQGPDQHGKLRLVK